MRVWFPAGMEMVAFKTAQTIVKLGLRPALQNYFCGVN